MTDSKQHVQLPNNMTKSGKLSPKDLLVYLTIKSFMNKDTKECFPSLDTIVKISGISKPTVRKSIEALKAENYLSVRIQGRSNVYRFNSHKFFEPFSYDFLRDAQLDASLKAYVAATQQSMFKETEGYGKVSYTDKELSQIINLDPRTIAKYNKQLEGMGKLTRVKSNKKDKITGLKEDEKIFHLGEMNQAIIWTIQKNSDDIVDLQVKTDAMKYSHDKDMEMVLRELRRVKEDNQKLQNIVANAGLDPEKTLDSDSIIM